MNNKPNSFDINNIQLTIQSPHFEMNEELNNYIVSQIEKLGKFNKRIDRCETLLRTRKNNKRDNCEVEVKLFVPGKVLFAIEHKSNFRLAAQAVFENLFQQISKFKSQLTKMSSEKIVV